METFLCCMVTRYFQAIPCCTCGGLVILFLAFNFLLYIFIIFPFGCLSETTQLHCWA